MVAVCLWAVERHLDGTYRQAFVLGFVAALLRPEVWPFLGALRPVAVLIDRRALWLVVSGGVLTLALWFLPEYWGSGNSSAPPTARSSRTRTARRSPRTRSWRSSRTRGGS